MLTKIHYFQTCPHYDHLSVQFKKIDPVYFKILPAHLTIENHSK